MFTLSILPVTYIEVSGNPDTWDKILSERVCDLSPNCKVILAIYPITSEQDQQGHYDLLMHKMTEAGQKLGWEFRKALIENDPIAAATIAHNHRQWECMMQDGGENRRSWQESMKGKFSGYIVAERKIRLSSRKQ